MNGIQLLPIANHLWQSTLFAGLAWLLTLVLRRNDARIRHSLWLVASYKFLIPFSVLMALGGQVRWRTAPEITRSGLLAVVDQVSQPFAPLVATSSPPSATAPAANPLLAILWGAWACGFLGIAVAWCVRWRRLPAAIRVGSPMQRHGIPLPVISSPALFEPGVFGIFQPVLLLPEGIFDR
jgi:bla regulator protein blaR1